MNLETPKVGFVEAFKLYWTNYVNFKGEVVGVSIGGHVMASHHYDTSVIF